MSHQSFAAIWSHLETRTDINNILCDLIGQHNLESCVLGIGSNELLDASLRLVVFIKVIFDLQRTHLQGSGPSSESSLLLQPRQLWFAIVYLLRIKQSLLRCSEASSTQYAARRSIIAQALVSGLRALLLRRHPLSSVEITQLRNALEEAWNGDELTDLERFVVENLCPKIFIVLSGTPSDLCYPACNKVGLRDYRAGLDSLEFRSDELVVTVREASSSLHRDTSNWFCHYWVLFDIVWATEAALIQFCVNSSKLRVTATEAQNDVNQFHSSRMKVLGEIFGSLSVGEGSWSGAEDSIAGTLLSPCFGGSCLCQEARSDQLRSLDFTSAPFGSLEGRRHRTSDTAMNRFLDDSLASLATALESRKEELRDCNRELSDLSDSLDKYLDAWYLERSSIRSIDSSCLDRRKAYIVPCPKLHPIPYDVLRGLIEHSPGKVGLEDLERNSPQFRVDITCSQCEFQCRIKWVRQIEPLYGISTTISEKLNRQPLAQREWFREATRGVYPPRHSVGNSTLQSSDSTGSSNPSLGAKKPLRKDGCLQEFFGQPSNLLSRNLLSYSFSADGRSLLAWVGLRGPVVFYDVSSHVSERHPIDDVYLAAAGTKLYAIISSSDRRSLRIYRRSDGGLVVCKLSILPSNIPLQLIAMSRNDNYVALAFASEVWVYRVEDQEIHCHKLPFGDLRLDSQRVCFSADSEEIVVATRRATGNVYTYVSHCMTDSTHSDLPIVKIPKAPTKDYGLSSVLYNNNSGYVCITAFTGTRYPVLISPSSRDVRHLDQMHHSHLGTQIQCAALCPSGLKLTLVNSTNEVFSAQRSPDTYWHVDKLGHRHTVRNSVVTPPHMIAIAMPDDDTIHFFWIEGDKWELVTMSGW